MLANKFRDSRGHEIAASLPFALYILAVNFYFDFLISVPPHASHGCLDLASASQGAAPHSEKSYPDFFIV